jgi:hypothetical protein
MKKLMSMFVLSLTCLVATAENLSTADLCLKFPQNTNSTLACAVKRQVAALSHRPETAKSHRDNVVPFQPSKKDFFNDLADLNKKLCAMTPEQVREFACSRFLGAKKVKCENDITAAITSNTTCSAGAQINEAAPIHN